MIASLVLGALIAQATTAPTCADPNREATVTHVGPIQSPPDLREPVTVLVQVTVGADGNIVNSMIYKSSGSVIIDRAAIVAALKSAYAPKLVNCVPTPGDYLFRAEFAASSGRPSLPAPTLGPISLPTFTPPANWRATKRFTPTAEWVDDYLNLLSIDAIRERTTLDQMRTNLIKTQAHADIALVEAELIKTCHDSQDALRVVYYNTVTGPPGGKFFREGRWISRNGVLYGLFYETTSGMQPSAEVRAAMDTFCAP